MGGIGIGSWCLRRVTSVHVLLQASHRRLQTTPSSAGHLVTVKTLRDKQKGQLHAIRDLPEARIVVTRARVRL